MRKEPENQNQHKVAQSYLKQFGYIKDDIPMISGMKLGDNHTSNFVIKDILAEINHFDFPIVEDFSMRRHYENTSADIESRLTTILNNIENQKQIPPKDRDILNHLTATMLCKTDKFRDDIIYFLNHSRESAESIVDEITMITGNKNELLTLLHIIEQVNHDSNDKLNLIIGQLTNHLAEVFSYFNKIILQAPVKLGWLTTDNPATIHHQKDRGLLISIDSEIYFPLSRKYCLFMFHKDSEFSQNKLRKLKNHKLNDVNEETLEQVNRITARNYSKYLFFFEEIEEHYFGMK